MTLFVYLSDVVRNQPNIVVLTGSFDSAYVGENATLASTGIFIFGTISTVSALGANQTVDIAGTVIGQIPVGFSAGSAQLNVLEGGRLISSFLGFFFESNGYLLNQGEIRGADGVRALGSLTTVNHGTISSTGLALELRAGGSVVNTGDISGSTAILSNAALQLTNHGTIISLASSPSIGITLSGFVDTVLNTGTISGDILMNGGDDVFDTSDGRVDGKVGLGTGDDIYLGSLRADIVTGDLGRDTMDGGGGSDRFVALDADGNDLIDGGTGLDTFDARQVTTALTVNLLTGLARTAGDTDTLLGIERVFGGSGPNHLTGNDADNLLRGGFGNDTLTGGLGNDRLQDVAGRNLFDGGDGDDLLEGGDEIDILKGGNGDDVLTGSYGIDVLTGGAGADRFVWRGDFDEFLGFGGLERITDFEQGSDRIDLYAFDANQSIAGNEAFTFIGRNVVTGFGELSYRTTATATYISIGFNTAAPAEVLRLDGVFTLSAADFVL